MALSDIAICNMALGHLGRTVAAIQSLTEKSVEARLCQAWYDQCRQEVLEIHDWVFARQRQPLSLHGDAPPIEWAFRYQVPQNMLAFRRLWNPYADVPRLQQDWFFTADVGDTVPYQMELSLDGLSQSLLTNMESAIGLYTVDVKLVSLFTPQFTNALSHYLAAKIALGVTGKQSMEDKEAKAFQAALGAATGSSANQGVAPAVREAWSIRSRN
jgi:hypothetical protein